MKCEKCGQEILVNWENFEKKIIGIGCRKGCEKQMYFKQITKEEVPSLMDVMKDKAKEMI